MANLTKSKKKKAVDDKPIIYTAVEPEKEKETVESKLKQAGEKAESLLSNASFKVGEEESPEFMPHEIGSSEETKGEKPEGGVRPVDSFDDLLGALSDIDRNFEGVTDADYYPEDYLDEALKSNIPNSLDLEKLEVPEIDEERLRADITETETKKTEAEKELKQQTAKKNEDLKREQIKELKAKSDEDREEIQEIYDEYRVSVENDAIKRGLARSSVAILSMDNVEAGRAKELSNVAENLTKSINKVEAEIVELQQDLETSLSNLDLELATNINQKLEEKIEKLKEEQQKAIKFNNEVNEMEANYQLKRGDKSEEIKAIEEELRKKYEGVAQQDKADQKLQTALDFFATMDRTKALEIIINSPELAESLGSGYYDLYYYVMRR